MVTTDSLWVFGYGSLCWNPGFDYEQSVIGYVSGFARKFWQGNTTHRGTPDKSKLELLSQEAILLTKSHGAFFSKARRESSPGRVATLVEDEHSLTYGIAFHLKEREALHYLFNRETKLGGYTCHLTRFYPTESSECRSPFSVLFYIAKPSNQHWLGPASEVEIAQHVLTCSGDSGHNVEYVLRLADWFRSFLPGIYDHHLFAVDQRIRFEIEKQKLDDRVFNTLIC